MAIKVQYPAGVSAVTVAGLYQWDYGQTLEIECAEIGTEILEVHFACHNMTEAIVRACTFSNGVGTVTIPDECLEQTSAITAWIYEVDSTQGHTIKTITLPIIARTRPSRSRDIPTDYVDTYGQLIEEVNKAVDALESGDVTVAKANAANTAGYATAAGSAQSVTYASSAGSASTAGHASTAGSAAKADQATIVGMPGVEYAASVNSNGEANISFNPAEHLNTMFAVEFQEEDTSGNRLRAHSGVLCIIDTALPLYYVRLGQFTMLCKTSSNSISLTKDSTSTGAPGALRFYKLGEFYV